MMKTLQIGLEWFPERAGGLPRYYFDLMKHARPHFEFRGLVLGSEAVATTTEGLIRAFAPQSASAMTKAMELRRAVRQFQQEIDFDLMVSHFALSALPALDRLKRPLVVHFHGPWAAESKMEGQPFLQVRAKQAIETAVYSQAKSFVVLSRAFGLLLHQTYGVPEDRIHVVPGGVDFARFDIDIDQRDARVRLGWPTDRPILLAVRRLARRMGLEMLIEAIGAVKRRYPDVLLMIAGKGALGPELQHRIDASGLSDNVRLLGFVSDDDLPLVYRAANFSVVPTQALEGFGLIALESLAAGTPVAVTPVDGLPEIVLPLSPDLVFEDRGAAAIGAGLTALLDGGIAPDAEACRRYAQGFDWTFISSQVAQVYKKAVS